MSSHSNKTFGEFISTLPFPAGAVLMVHSAFSAIRREFPLLTIEAMIASLQQKLTPAGSLIMPTFTYCFKRTDGSHDIFDRHHSPSKVGAVSEVFRNLANVIRTSSPTHSFALWGQAARDISWRNAPTSPLGAGSVLEWLAHQPHAYILLLGVHFSSLSFIHYLETLAPVPWVDVSPWEHLGVLTIGVSIHGEQPLIQVPGCAKSFTQLERYLLRKKVITKYHWHRLSYYLLPVPILQEQALPYLQKFPLRLLCPAHSCPACDSRRSFYENLTVTKQ